MLDQYADKMQDITSLAPVGILQANGGYGRCIAVCTKWSGGSSGCWMYGGGSCHVKGRIGPDIICQDAGGR